MKLCDKYNNFTSESFLDYPDNSNLAVVFYMPGCDRKCVGCQNTPLQEPVEYKNIDTLPSFLLERCKKARTNKLCLQGGDPLYKNNLNLTKFLLEKLHKELDICIYTGAEKDEVKKSGLNGFKFIKCGKFMPDLFIGSKKTDKYIQFATKNQYLLDKDFNLLSQDGIYYF